MSAEIRKKNIVPLGFIGLFAVLTAGFMVAGFLDYRGYEKRYRTQVERELSAIADLKVEELTQWRRERLGDAKIIFNNTALFRQTSRYFRGPQDDGVEQQMRVWVSQYQGHYDYDEVSLLDPKGAVRMSSPSGRTFVPAAVLQRVPEVLRSGRITFVDFYRHDHDKRIHLSVLIPILDVSTENRAIGAVALRVDPEKYLFPFILRWPTPSTTAETVLVRREGDAVLYLNELKFRKDAALGLRIPLTRTDVPPVMAVLGRSGIVEGPDHQNEQAIADIRAVPGSPWFLVTRMNASEVYAPMRERLWTLLGLVAALLFGAGAGLAFVWRRQDLRYYRERFQASEDLEKGRLMLAETEKLGKVGGWELNIDTGKLTWTEELYNLHEADPAYDPTAGKGTDFYTPASRPLIEQAMQRAVEHGEPFDLKLEIITAKSNRRSVHVLGKADLDRRRIYGFIQDITESTRAEEELRLQGEIMAHMAEAVYLVSMTDGSIVYTNPIFDKMFGYEQGEMIGKHVSIVNAPFEKEPEARAREIMDSLAEKGSWQGEIRNIRKDGTLFWCYANVSLFEHSKYGRVSVAVHSDITERKRADQLLRSKSELLERIFVTMHFSLVYLDREFNFIRVNTAYAKACGYPEDFFPGKNHFQLYPNAENEAIFREVVQSGNSFMIRAKPFANPDHPEWGITYWDWTLHPLKDATGTVEALLLVLLDVSEAKRAELALRDAEARYRLLFEQSPNGVLLIDFETGKAVETNEVAHRQLGYTREEFAALRISDYEVLERPEDTERRLNSILREGGDDFDTLHRTKSGELRNVHVSVKALELGGRVLAYCIFQDITERMQAEQRYQHILKTAIDGFWVSDSRGRLLEVNDAYCRMSGYSREELMLMSVADLDAVENPEEIARHIDKVIKQGYERFESKHRRKDGTLMDVEISAQYLHEHGGIFISFFQDITERKQAAEALQKSEKMLQAIFDAEPECVKLLDENANLIMMNRAGLDMLQVDSLDQVKGQCVCPMVTSEYREAFLGLTKRIFQGESGILMFEMIGRKGRRLWLETHAVPLRNEKNEITALLGVTRDVTGRKKLEDQLLQSQKMESIGTLAGGVAHDFNNILTAISGSGHLLLMKMAAGDPLLLSVRDILASVERAAHLTRDLLLFSRKQPIKRKPVDLNENIHKLGRFLARVIGEDIEFKTRLSGGAIRVLGDSHQLDQILMNLATNARDAMPKGGAFSVTTDQVLLDETFTSAHGLGTPGKYALITVSDTGLGMNEDTRQRIFEPFFTTKEVGKGTGLGMAVVYGIVKQHDGLVNVYSEPGRGTTFRIYLPVIAGAAIEERENVAEERPVGGPETILLAEDDKSVRNVTAHILRDMGYTVITAEDGVDAIEKFTENKDSIALLLFDLIMPRKNGKDAYEEIKAIKPDIKVFFLSGYSNDIIDKKGILDENLIFLSKPSSPAVLLSKIREILDR